MNPNHDHVEPVSTPATETEVSDSIKAENRPIQSDLPLGPPTDVTPPTLPRFEPDLPMSSFENPTEMDWCPDPWWHLALLTPGYSYYLGNTEDFRPRKRTRVSENPSSILRAQHRSWLRTRGWTKAQISGLEHLCREIRMGKTQKEIMAEIEKFETPTAQKTDGKLAPKKVKGASVWAESKKKVWI